MRKFWLILSLIIITGVTFLIYRRMPTAATSTTAPTTEFQTVRVERGTIVATAFAVGNLAPRHEVNLVFSTLGTVAEVNIEEGDYVETGQILATLDTTDLEWDVANAELNLEITEAELDRLKAKPDEGVLASTQARLVAAQEVLSATLTGASPDDIAAANATLAAAQANYNLVVSKPQPEAIRRAELQLEQAKNSLWNAQAQRDVACNLELKSTSVCDAHEAIVGNGHVQIEMALLAVEQAKAPATEAEIQQARSQVQSAQAQLDKLLAGPGQADIATAEAQVIQVQAQLDQLQAGPSPEELHIAETRVQQARLALQRLKDKLSDTVIVAPFSGVVSAIGYRPGDVVRPELVGIILVDLSELQIELKVAEVDIGQVQIGQPAEIILDAFPDRAIAGKVASIASAARSELGVVNYPVTITLAENAPNFKPGMTGNVSIMVGQRENVLLVPNRAVRRARGRYLVKILQGNQPIDVPVRIGLNNETMTEIVSGLTEGEQVVLNLN